MTTEVVTLARERKRVALSSMSFPRSRKARVGELDTIRLMEVFVYLRSSERSRLRTRLSTFGE